jgi:hypothetical protein
MFKISRTRSWPPAIDLSTVRKTVAYMRGDIARVPGLEKIAAALDTAIKEIDAVDTRPRVHNITDSVLRSRFLPRKH